MPTTHADFHAFLLSVILPFLVAIPFLSHYTTLSSMLAWSSLLIFALIDVGVPLWLYLSVLHWKVMALFPDVAPMVRSIVSSPAPIS